MKSRSSKHRKPKPSGRDEDNRNQQTGRVVDILTLLATEPRTTESLAEALGVGERTVMRTIRVLEKKGMPIYIQRAVNPDTHQRWALGDVGKWLAGFQRKNGGMTKP